MDDLRELYQEVIVDHSRHPRNFVELQNATHQAEGFNRLCGDKLNLFLHVKDNVIEEITFKGTGCAISTASASLMTEQLRGKTLAQAQQLFNSFHAALTSEHIPHSIHDQLGKLAVFMGVREFPARVKCATLAWHTLHAALIKDSQAVSTEESDI